MAREVRITHRSTGTLIAQGPLGWPISARCLKALFVPNYVPGFCIYKFLYVWMDLVLPGGERERGIGWLYWLPNPLFPFIWYRVAVCASDPAFKIEESALKKA
jgi:hypothetical protein